MWHTPAIHHVGHQRSDKNGLARPRKTGHADAHHRFKECLGYGILHGLNLAQHRIGECGNDQNVCAPEVRALRT